MDKIFIKYILLYYFAFSALDGFLSMKGYTSLNKLNLILLLSNIFVAISYLLKKNIGRLNLYIFFFAFIFILYGFTCQIRLQLLLFGIKYQFLWMLAFLSGQDYRLSPHKVAEKGYIVVTIVGIVGLFWFFSPPEWYLPWKLGDSRNESSILLLEMSRLSAFWKYPYWVSYGSAIVLYYILTRIFQNDLKYKNIYTYFIIFLLIIILICCQQRAPLFFSILAYFVLLMLSLKEGEKKNNFKYCSITIFSLLAIIAIFLLNRISTDIIDYAIEKFSNVTEGGFLSRRIGMFSSVSHAGLLLMGEGLGKYSHAANQLGLPSITDSQWLSIFHEMGIVGIFFYASLFIYILYLAVKNYKDNIFEIGIILLFFLSMIGANPLSVEEEHTYIFWLCCGSVYRKSHIKYLSYEKKKNHSNQLTPISSI